MDGMTLEELLVDMENDAADETIDAAMARAVEAEMQLAILATEGLGSIRVLERVGWFRYRNLPENFVRTLMLLAPASRGGENRTMMAERIWEAHVDHITEVFGYEVIEKLHAKFEELFAQNKLSKEEKNSP